MHVDTGVSLEGILIFYHMKFRDERIKHSQNTLYYNFFGCLNVGGCTVRVI